ncbi:hypothetical protein ACFX2F_022272 [Malus domestica]
MGRCETPLQGLRLQCVLNGRDVESNPKAIIDKLRKGTTTDTAVEGIVHDILHLCGNLRHACIFPVYSKRVQQKSGYSFW